MKKLMIAAATAAVGAGVYAAALDAQVYDFSLTVKSTACKEIKYTRTIAALEGADYKEVKGEKLSVRKQGTTKVAGVIWGCDCETIADPQWRTYNNGTTVGGYLFWNVGSDTPFSIYTTTFAWAVFNRIDTGDKAEGVWGLVNTDADNVVGFFGAGFGKVSGTGEANCRVVLSSMSGNFAGFILAGSDAAGCRFCGGTSCTAWQICANCVVRNPYDLDMTAAYGSWKIKYNKSASKKLRSTGRLTQSYKFSKAGNSKELLAKVENAAAKGLLASDDYDDDEEFDWEEYAGNVIEKDAVGDVAYGTYDAESGEYVAGEKPEEYDGDSILIGAILAAIDAS